VDGYFDRFISRGCAGSDRVLARFIKRTFVSRRILVVFWKQVWSLVVGFINLLWKQRVDDEQGILALKLGVATILTVLVALVIEPFFGELLTLPVVASTLIVTGGLILIAEKFRPKRIVEFTWPIALWLGVVQGFAVIPGISRSGLTIAFLILLGLQRRRAAELSFLLSIPTILAAGLYALKDIEPGTSIDTALIAACAAAFLTGLVMIYSMLKLVEKHWIWFAPYCVGLGLFLLFL